METLAFYYAATGLPVFFAALTGWQIVAIFACFVWSGFVRSALSFGGAAFALPLLLFIYPEPLFFLPIIAVHLLVFGIFSVVKRIHLVDYSYLRKLLLLLLPTKIIGIIGLLQLPVDVLVAIIYGFSLFYAFHYLLFAHAGTDKPAGKKTKITEAVMLLLGGYMSGTALSGAPLIVAVTAKNVTRESLRATLFALWVILVTIKLSAMQYAGFSLHLAHHLWLMPAVTIGNIIGTRVHSYMQTVSDKVYYRIIGLVLLLLGAIGLVGFFSEMA